MDFCKKCGSLMVAQETNKKVFLTCRKCGATQKEYKAMEIKETVEHAPTDDVIVVEKNKEMLPTTKVVCPECGNKEAAWWMQQTRSIDEAPTLFFRCTKCKHSWREYG